jgi:hypothetical protein
MKMHARIRRLDRVAAMLREWAPTPNIWSFEHV